MAALRTEKRFFFEHSFTLISLGVPNPSLTLSESTNGYCQSQSGGVGRGLGVGMGLGVGVALGVNPRLRIVPPKPTAVFKETLERS